MNRIDEYTPLAWHKGQSQWVLGYDLHQSAGFPKVSKKQLCQENTDNVIIHP